MAYGKKYNYYFYWDHNSSNNYYEVAFYIDGYASTVTELTAGPNPFVVDIKGQKDSFDKIIRGSEASMVFIVEKSDISAIDTDFLTIDYKDVIVKLIQDPSGTPLTKWVGILQPENCDREFLGNKFSYQVSAVDGLADLKNVFYTTSGKENGSLYTGFEDKLTIIKTALSKVADITELQLDFRIQLGTFSDQMTSTQNALKENEVVQELFNTVNNEGDNEPNTCYEVIEKILAPYFCVLTQSDGYYQIWCLGESNSYFFEYDWSTLTQQSRTARNRAINFQNTSGTYKNFNRGTLSKIPPYRRYTILLNNKEYATLLLSNGGFDSNITGWSNGDAGGGINVWDSISWYNYPSIGGTLLAEWAGGASAGTYKFATTNTITLVPSGSSVSVTLRAEQSVFSHSGSDPNLLRARLYNGTNGYSDASEGQIPFYATGGFQAFQFTFDASDFTVAGNYLEFEVEVQDATTTNVEFYFDNVVLTQASANNPTDWKYTSIYTSGTQYEDKEIELYIGDQPEASTDACGIKDSGGTFTSTWSRYGVTDNLALVYLLMQYANNANSKFNDYIRVLVYDPSETIEIFNILYSNELSITARYFDIIGMRKDYREATIDLILKQNGIGVSDVSYTTYSQKLSTIYGDNP